MKIKQASIQKRKSLRTVTGDYNYLLRLPYDELTEENIHYQTLTMKKPYDNVC